MAQRAANKSDSYNMMRVFRRLLEEFTTDIDSAGGVFQYDGTEVFAPAGAKDWTDLGATYIKACKALGKKPTINED